MAIFHTPPFFSYRIGKYELILLTEEQTVRNLSAFTSLPPELTADEAPRTYPDAINAFLLKTPDDIYLFDTGFGDGLPERLKKAGVSPKDVSKIFITHMHPDHIGGLIWMGAPLFDQARLIISQAEYDYWNSAEIERLTPEAMRPAFGQAQEIFTAYRERLELIMPYAIHEPFDDGVESVEAYGHTIGHTAYLISSEEKQLLIWGDLALAVDVQLPYPDVVAGHEINPSKSVRSRRRILNYLVRHKVPVAGMHIAYPGMGMVVENPDTNGYKFIPFE